MEDGRCKIVGGADRELSWVVLAVQTSGASRGAARRGGVGGGVRLSSLQSRRE